MDGLINQEQLSDWSGHTQPRDLERWLIERGIKYHIASGRYVTTITAINASLKLDSHNKVDDDIDFL